MSEWTSLNEIMRDLSVAQGCTVPASLKTFGSTEPPTVKTEQATEAEFYKSCGDTDFTQPADYHLIKHMLTIVTKQKEEDSIQNIAQNSELNPLSTEFIPRSEMANIKRKEKRNVAMTSILEAREMSQTAKQANAKSPVNMFRKKQDPNKKKQIAAVKPTHTTNVCTNNGQYIPSKLANLYYNKYLSNAKLKEELKDDIWSRAEKAMKKADERIKSRKESSCSSSRDSEEGSVKSSDTGSTGLEYTKLPCHRHVMLDDLEDCVVCNIAAKHGYYFENELD